VPAAGARQRHPKRCARAHAVAGRRGVLGASASHWGRGAWVAPHCSGARAPVAVLGIRLQRRAAGALPRRTGAPGARELFGLPPCPQGHRRPLTPACGLFSPALVLLRSRGRQRVRAGPRRRGAAPLRLPRGPAAAPAGSGRRRGGRGPCGRGATGAAGAAAGRGCSGQRRARAQPPQERAGAAAAAGPAAAGGGRPAAAAAAAGARPAAAAAAVAGAAAADGGGLEPAGLPQGSGPAGPSHTGGVRPPPQRALRHRCARGPVASGLGGPGRDRACGQERQAARPPVRQHGTIHPARRRAPVLLPLVARARPC
jgi:hypothetical protein